MNKKNTISAKKLNKDTIIQTLYMDDYFGEGVPHVSKPEKFDKFLKDLAYDLEMDQLKKDVLYAESEDGDVCNLVEEYYQGCGDGNENYCLVTIVDGVIKAIKP